MVQYPMITKVLADASYHSKVTDHTTVLGTDVELVRSAQRH